MKASKPNQSVEKTIRIIEALAKSSSPTRLSDLSDVLSLPPSTTLRMINTLVDLGYAYQDAETKKYGLTLRFHQIGQMVRDQLPYYDIVHPHLLRLEKDTGETCCATRLHGNKVQYFDVVVGHHAGALTIRQQLGGTAFMHCTGSGKTFLSQYNEQQLDELIADPGLPAFTPKTITDKETLIAELEKCRKQGYALDDEEVELGMRCIGIPIHDDRGQVIISLCISGPISRMSDERCDTELLPLIWKTASAITTALTGTPAPTP